jgi:hypothetical protein
VTLSEIEARKIRHATIARLLQFLTKGARTAAATGRRAELFNFLINASEYQRQRHLAKRLHISEARASQLLKFFRQKLPQLQGDGEAALKLSSRPEFFI